MADQDPAKPPTPAQYLERLKAHRAVAIAITIGTIVIALASFTDAIKKLTAAFQTQRPADARQELARLSIPYTVDAFSSAAGKGDLVATRLFLAAGMPVDEIPTDEVPTALIAAVRENRPEIVALLLKARADPELRIDDFGSANSDDRMIDLLKKNGARWTSCSPACSHILRVVL